jgi:hypothetical protein
MLTSPQPTNSEPSSGQHAWQPHRCSGGQHPPSLQTPADLSAPLKSVVGVAAHPLVAIRRPGIAPAAVIAEAKAQTKTNPGPEEAAASEATTGKATASKPAAETTSTEAAVETASSVETASAATASERQGICRNCCGANETGRGKRDSNLA